MRAEPVSGCQQIACAAHFPVDWRNENLPEKCTHRNCASRQTPLRVLVAPKGMPFDPPSWSDLRNHWLQETAVGSASCFRLVLYREPCNFNVSLEFWPSVAGYGASST